MVMLLRLVRFLEWTSKMVFQNTPSDRMHLVGLGELLSPARCMVCGNGTCEEGYVQLGVWYDYEGEQYICRTCLVQAAELIGCLEPGEAQHLQGQATKLAEDNTRISHELAEANERLTVFNGAIASISSGVLSIPTGSPVGYSSDVLTVGTSDEVVTGNVAESGSTESESPESITSTDSGSIESPTVHDSTKAKPVIPRI
jgi:hypothetical protein